MTEERELFRPAGQDGSADVLRTIRAVGMDKVAVPWMMLEEAAAQHAVKYQGKHAAAGQAMEAVSQLMPWELDATLGRATSTASGSTGVRRTGPLRAAPLHHPHGER